MFWHGLRIVPLCTYSRGLVDSPVTLCRKIKCQLPPQYRVTSQANSFALAPQLGFTWLFPALKTVYSRVYARYRNGLVRTL